MKPTIIGSSHLQPTAVPTVLPSGGLPAGQAGVTENPSNSAPALVPTKVVSSELVLSNGPTALNGVERKPLDVSSDQIRNTFPDLGSDVIEEVISLLAGTVPEAITEMHCLKWGETTLAQYGKALEMFLSLSQSSVLLAVPQHLLRLHELVEGVSKQLSPKSSAIWFKANRLIGAFDRGIDEIKQIIDLLVAMLSELYEVHAQLLKHEQCFNTISRKLTSETIAAGILASELPGNKKTMLADVSVSLSKASLHASEHVLVVRNKNDHVQTLIQIVRERVLVSLPAWISNFYTVGEGQLTETHRFALNQSLVEIASSLKLK